MEKLCESTGMEICDRGDWGQFAFSFFEFQLVFIFWFCNWKLDLVFLKKRELEWIARIFFLKNFACFSDTPQSILIRTITGAQKRWPSENVYTQTHVCVCSKQTKRSLRTDRQTHARTPPSLSFFIISARWYTYLFYPSHAHIRMQAMWKRNGKSSLLIKKWMCVRV